MRRIGKLVIMASTYEGDGIESASREHNGCVDPIATRIVMESCIPATVVGLNVTMRVKVHSGEVAALRTTPFGEYLAAMTSRYLDITGREVAYMHDPLAVSTVLKPSLVTTRKMRAQVLDDGRVAYYSDPDGALDVCTDVDASSFESFLISRISELASRQKGD
ncbi:MAG: nucleoside hydrolase, partial [Armatimonadota bacterium]